MTAADTIRGLASLTPDFPAPGVLFRDLSPVFAHGPALAEVAAALAAPFAGEFDAVLGLDARGFILASAAAVQTGTGMIAIRKAGKLPPPVIAETYTLEYGTAALEVDPSLAPGGTRVLVVDDVLATGGTAGAAIRLAERAGWRVCGVAVALELEALGGRTALGGDLRVHALVRE